MGINEIRESGLLELYVMDTLEGQELKEVEKALSEFPELKADLNIIERALQAYAYASAVSPSAGLKERILEEARKSPPTSGGDSKNNKSKGNSNNGLLGALIALLSLLSLFFAFSWFSSSQEMEEMEQRHQIENEACDSIQAASNLQFALYQGLTNPNNAIISNSTHPKYAETEIYFYHNPVDKKNYLQLNALPTIDNNTQSYQLWSIIGDNPPRPLDVFQSDEDVLQVEHIEGTQVYAITIEQKGGAQSPTMDDLIGTFTI